MRTTSQTDTSKDLHKRKNEEREKMRCEEQKGAQQGRAYLASLGEGSNQNVFGIVKRSEGPRATGGSDSLMTFHLVDESLGESDRGVAVQLFLGNANLFPAKIEPMRTIIKIPRLTRKTKSEGLVNHLLDRTGGFFLFSITSTGPQYQPYDSYQNMAYQGSSDDRRALEALADAFIAATPVGPLPFSAVAPGTCFTAYGYVLRLEERAEKAVIYLSDTTEVVLKLQVWERPRNELPQLGQCVAIKNIRAKEVQAGQLHVSVSRSAPWHWEEIRDPYIKDILFRTSPEEKALASRFLFARSLRVLARLSRRDLQQLCRAVDQCHQSEQPDHSDPSVDDDTGLVFGAEVVGTGTAGEPEAEMEPEMGTENDLEVDVAESPVTAGQDQPKDRDAGPDVSSRALKYLKKPIGLAALVSEKGNCYLALDQDPKLYAEIRQCPRKKYYTINSEDNRHVYFDLQSLYRNSYTSLDTVATREVAHFQNIPIIFEYLEEPVRNFETPKLVFLNHPEGLQSAANIPTIYVIGPKQQ